MGGDGVLEEGSALVMTFTYFELLEKADQKYKLLFRGAHLVCVCVCACVCACVHMEMGVDLKS